MDEFIPGNTDPERRGRGAYERWCAAMEGRWKRWAELSPDNRERWQTIAEAAFEEGRAFERESASDGVKLAPGEKMVSYAYRTVRGNVVEVSIPEGGA